MKKLVYIASTGYSGSTLLDMLLNNNKEITALGEVYLLSMYARDNSNCTCGSPVNDCDFWNKTESSLRESLRQPDMSLADYPLTVEAKVQSLDRKIPKLNDVLLLLGSRMIWKLFSGFSEISNEYMRVANNALRLFDVISKNENTPVIVDSSKYAIPMKALYLNSPVPVKIIYLVRDGRAVCRTLRRRHNMSYEEAARYWVRYNWNLKLIMMTIPSRNIKLVRYEDLCNDTDAELSDIYDFIDVQQSADTILKKEACHNIGGNPMRFRKEESVIKVDEKWRDEITDKEFELFENIAGKMNRSFGYQ